MFKIPNAMLFCNRVHLL